MKCAVVGTGHIARQHLACLKTLTGVEVAAVCDLSPAMAESAAERFGVSRWFTDYREMLDRVKPDIVHITTPPGSHLALAINAIDSGAHVLIEKPITVGYDDFMTLRRHAEQRGRLLIEDHNYLFNGAVQNILDHARYGALGEVVHVEIMLCLNILDRDSRFVDADAPHPSLALPGGAIGDFLTHMAYLAIAFVGSHRGVSTFWSKRASNGALPSDEFRSLVKAERGTASLVFSSHAQPDVFWIRVHGTKMRCTANLFEPRLVEERPHGGPRPLIPFRNGIRESWDVARSAVGGMAHKLGGRPGGYEGLWELLRRVYESLAAGKSPPISLDQIDDVSRLVSALTDEDNRL